MFPIVLSIGNNLNKKVRLMCEAKEEVDARQLAGAFTLDTIILVSMATETHSLLQDKPSDFLMMMSKMMSDTYWTKLSFSTMSLLPELGKFLKMTSFSKLYNATMKKLFHEIYNERIRSGETRGDLIDALIGIKRDEANDEDKGKKEVL